MLRAYETACRAAGHRPATIELRRVLLQRLARNTGIPLDAQTPDTLAAWLARPSWSHETRRAARNALVGFYRWAHGTGRLAADPAAGLPPIRPAPPAPRPIPETALALALAEADPRQALAISLGASAGLRVSEAAAVNTADLETDLLGPCLRVHGKGGKTRIVPIHETLAAQIRLAAKTSPAGWAFPNPKTPARHISGNHLGRICRPILAPYTFHALRHRYATVTHAGSGDLLAVCRLLGHASPTTTQRYVQTDAATLRAVALAAA